jgi:hypothetical protein
MCGEKKGLQLPVIGIVIGLLLVSFNLVYGEREVSMPVRPFAVDPENRHLRLDGLFDVSSGNHIIGVFLKNESEDTIYNVTARASFEPGSGIVLKKDFEEFGTLKPGIPVPGFFEANFDASAPGKYRLIMEVSGDSFKDTISRHLFVIRSESDPIHPNKWTVHTPEGKITIHIRELYSGTGLGSSIAGKSFKWSVEHVPFKGQFSRLPYSDPWWIVPGSIVPVGGGPTTIDRKITELCGEGWGNTIGSIVRTAFAASTLAVTADESDPFRRGQMNTRPGPDEITEKEEVDVSMAFPSMEPVVGRAYTANVKWTYTRTTDARTYSYDVREKVSNKHFVKKPPEVKIKRRKSGGGPEFIITARTQKPKGMKDNYAYFAANLFKADDRQLKNVEQSIVLRDDGHQGDRKAGDGTYTGVVSSDRLPPGSSLDVFVFGFDINSALESDSPETAAKKIGGVLISTPPFKFFSLVPNSIIKTSPKAPRAGKKKDTVDTKKTPVTVTKAAAVAKKAGAAAVKILPFPRFSLCIGGWASLDMGTIGIFEKNGAESPVNMFSAKDISGSFSWGFKLSLGIKLPKSHVIGVSSGLRFPKKDTFPLSFRGAELELSSFAIPVELFYRLPVGKNIFLEFAGGVDLYKSSLDTGSLTFKDSGTGIHVSLGAGYFLVKNLVLTFDAAYERAKLESFTGTIDMLESQLFVEEVEGVPVLVVDVKDASREPLAIDFSGLKLSVGMTFCLTR